MCIYTKYVIKCDKYEICSTTLVPNNGIRTLYQECLTHEYHTNVGTEAK